MERIIFFIKQVLILCILFTLWVIIFCPGAFGSEFTKVGTMQVPTDVYRSIFKWSMYYELDYTLLLALANQESNWKQSSRGADGEVGVFQIMMGTVQEYNWGKSTEEALTRYKLDDNCRLGCWYFKKKLDRFKGEWIQSIASYNCGESNAPHWQEINVTRRHVTKVLIYYCKLSGDEI